MGSTVREAAKLDVEHPARGTPAADIPGLAVRRGEDNTRSTVVMAPHQIKANFHGVNQVQVKPNTTPRADDLTAGGRKWTFDIDPGVMAAAVKTVSLRFKVNNDAPLLADTVSLCSTEAMFDIEEREGTSHTISEVDGVSVLQRNMLGTPEDKLARESVSTGTSSTTWLGATINGTESQEFIYRIPDLFLNLPGSELRTRTRSGPYKIVVTIPKTVFVSAGGAATEANVVLDTSSVSLTLEGFLSIASHEKSLDITWSGRPVAHDFFKTQVHTENLKLTSGTAAHLSPQLEGLCIGFILRVFPNSSGDPRDPATMDSRFLGDDAIVYIRRGAAGENLQAGRRTTYGRYYRSFLLSEDGVVNNDQISGQDTATDKPQNIHPIFFAENAVATYQRGTISNGVIPMTDDMTISITPGAGFVSAGEHTVSAHFYMLRQTFLGGPQGKRSFQQPTDLLAP